MARPFSRVFGADRGTPVDRVLIDTFLESHRQSITGAVLEIADREYIDKFGHGVTKVDILMLEPSPRATVIGDLSSGNGIPVSAYDCIVLTQTLQFVPRPEAAIRSCWRALAEGGSLLVTAPGISQISRYDMNRWGDYWRFTTKSLHQLLSDVFQGGVAITSYGNPSLACAFLLGLSAEELPTAAWTRHDPDYQVVICALATKSSPAGSP